MIQERLARLRAEMVNLALDAMLITDLTNARYLSGFTGSNATLLITQDSAFLLTDARYTEQANQESPDFDIQIGHIAWTGAAAALMEHLLPQRIGFEEAHLTYASWRGLAELMPDRDLIPTDAIVETLRMVKDDTEISAIRNAVRIVDATFEYLRDILRPGMTEYQIAFEIDCFMRRKGSPHEAFETLVTSGPRSALPHGKPTDRKVEAGEFLLMDYGAQCSGYTSDITRTVVLGEPEPRQREIYDVVLEAQRRAISAVRPGISGGEVDAVARDYITEMGYGDHFGHGLGHGLGMEVHDGRILGRNSEIVLQAGMVVTVEPGIYIPDYGGVRTEDDVLVTDSGPVVLTHSPKRITID